MEWPEYLKLWAFGDDKLCVFMCELIEDVKIYSMSLLAGE
jgi:hypothetical protein